MSDKKPNVFPNRGQKESSPEPNNQEFNQEAFDAEKAQAVRELFVNASRAEHIKNSGEANAIEEMRKRTEAQMEAKKQNIVIKYPDLSDKPMTRNDLEREEIIKRAEEQIKQRDISLQKNVEQTQNYQKQYEQVSVKPQVTMQTSKQSISPALPKEPEVYSVQEKSYISELSQPNFNSVFDVIPLPSQGKLYKNKKQNIRVSFLTAADENILTSPNLLQSGEFLEILINRKVLEPELRYKDLHIGDRNAIMIWLRATGYGEMYPVTLLDENGEQFETEVNLNDLKFKSLGAEPDEEGLFNFRFPLTKTDIKFKLLTCGDVDHIDTLLEQDKNVGIPVNNSSIYMMEKSIIEINGVRDINVIKDFVKNIRIKDAKDFKDYVSKIESGVDLNITVGTPRGGSINTFLPLTYKFFWPDFNV